MRQLSEVVKARIATALIFGINGALSGNWISRIPSIKSRMHATPGILGLALFGMPVGLLIGAVIASVLVKKFGDRQVVRGAALCYCLFVPFLGLVPNPFFLFLTFVGMGISGGVLDVSMNIQASVIEKEYKKPIMSSFHGLFSSGGLIGALIGGYLAGIGLSITMHLTLIAVVLALLTLLVYFWFLPTTASDEGPHFVKPTASLIGLGVISFCALMGEGAIGDWGGVYLKENIGTNITYSAFGYGAFSLCMAIARFAGDYLTEQIGRTTITRLGGLLGLIGMLFVLLSHSFILVILGFAAVGLGFAAIFPNVVSSASRNHTMSPHGAIAAVTTLGYLGFLLGPPLIGVSADILSLQISLGIIALLSLIIVLLSGSVK